MSDILEIILYIVGHVLLYVISVILCGERGALGVIAYKVCQLLMGF